MATRQLARLVVPLDTSATAEAVLPWAALVARDRAMTVHLMAVWSEAAPIPGLDRSRPTEELVAELREYLKGIAADPALQGVEVTLEARTGNITEEIRRATAAVPGSMIMLASHGQGGYQEAYLGSIADRLVRTARVPVLVIPAEQS